MSQTVNYTSPLPSEPNTTARRRIRWPIAFVLFAIALVGELYVHFSDIEENFKFPFALGVGLLALIAISIWMLLSPFRWQTKIVWLLAEVLPIVGIVFFIGHFMKMQGSYNGAGVPIFVLKSTPPADARLAPVAPIATTQAAPVDVTSTTPMDWPQFLGPDRTNEAPDPRLSRDWAAHPPKELWRQPVGAGWGSFAVVNGFAIHEEQRGNQEITTCLEARTGNVRWRHVNNVRFSEGMGGDGPRATPTIAQGKVYVMGATGILDCLDGATGQPLWSQNVLSDAQAKNLIWGKSCSPLVYDNFVIVTGGDPAGPDLLAYDIHTGKLAWRSGTDKAAYCSPTLCTLAGKREVTIVNAGSVTGADAADGHQLWSHPWPGGFPKVSQTIPFDNDRLFISAGYGVGAAMLHLSPGPGDTQTINVLWKNLKLKTEFTNIVVHNGFIFGLDDGILRCLNPADGSSKWRDGSYGHGQLLLAGDLIILQAESGDVALVEATEKSFNELGRFHPLSTKTWNNPALYGKLLLVRNDQEAACYELP